jgi:hypothetical protein
VLPAVGVAIVIGAAIFATVQLRDGPADTPVASPPTTSAAPPLTEAALDGVLLSIGDLNRIMGSTGMKVTSDVDEMADHSSDMVYKDCLGAIYGAEKPVYAGSGWTAVRDQVAREPGENNAHRVEQTAVLYPSAEQAQSFFHDSQSQWERCARNLLTVNSGESEAFWRLDDVTRENNLITQHSTQTTVDEWACQHALSVVSNLTVEVFACGYSIREEAATVANKMIANATEE